MTRFFPTPLVLLTIAGAGLVSPVHALVKFNDGHDQLFIAGTAGIGYDSNLFASNGGAGDSYAAASVDLEYQRRAGLLSVEGGLGWDFFQYQDLSDENSADPRASLELAKTTGRTTGALSVSAAREHRADSALNLRTASWSYDAGLHIKYPVIERYSVTETLAWSRTDFRDNFFLVDLRTWSANTDLFYAYNSQRDLFGGYRFRVTDTTSGSRDYDHAFSVGTTGRILPTIMGTARIGYQFRESQRSDGTREDFDAVSSNISATWTGISRLSVTGDLSSDFTTIATDASVETLSAGIEARYAFTTRVSAFAGIRGGRSRFLGRDGDNRRDTYWSLNAGVACAVNEHLKFALTAGNFENWSTQKFSDYTRGTISLNLSSRW